MKLVVSGASGYVGSEIVRQALADPRITSLIALSRSAIKLPDNLNDSADVGKFQNVLVEDYGTYSDEAKRAFEGVDAVLWTVAITPRSQRGMPVEEVRRVCLDCTLSGLEATYNASAATTQSGEGKTNFRFTYMSGFGVERDQKKTPGGPFWMHDYFWMRGQVENEVLAFPATHPGIECQIPKPGAITAAGHYSRIVLSYILNWFVGMPSLDVTECVAAMIEELVGGYTSETLEHRDLMRIGKDALEKKKS